MKTESNNLLTLAAKAAGVCVEFDKRGEPSIDDPIGGFSGSWNPLEDDGDALRLAVKIGMKIETPKYTGFGASANPYHQAFGCTSFDGEDAFSKTRKVIVIAAARIGEKME